MATAHTGARFCMAPLDLVAEAAALLADAEAEGVAAVEGARLKTVGIAVLMDEAEASERLEVEGMAE